MKSKITIQQIADAVNMSKYAVSRALSGKSGVSDETRYVIFEKAKQLGYKINTHLTVRNPLVSTQDHLNIQTILVLFPNIKYQDKESVYWGPVFNGISSRLNGFNINIVTLTEPDYESIFTLLNPDAIHGVIVVGGVSTATLQDLKRLNLPLVIIDHMDISIKSDTIFADNYNAISTIVETLISKGYTKYQFIGQINDAYSFYERWLAFKNTLEHHKILHEQRDELIYFKEHLKPLAREMYRSKPLPEVFVCANDAYAMFTKEAMDDLGYVLNKDYIVTGFDNTYHELEMYATVDVVKEQLGKRAVDQLIWRISNINAPYERCLIHTNVLYLSSHKS